MRVRLFSLVLCSAAATAFFAACGGGSPPPTAVAPADVIAFGARDADGGGRYGLYIVRPDGSGLRKLAEEDGFIFFPRWSPSGDRIAYAVGSEDEERAGALRVYDFETEAVTTVSQQALPSLSGPAAAWSPEGRRLAFAEAVDGGRIRIFDLERGELNDIPDIPGATADWSPERDELAFIRLDEPSSETDLYLMRSDGDDQRLLLERSGVESNPRWSPDGERLAVSATHVGEPDERSVLVVDRKEGRATELAPGSGPAWSPDSQWLAYAAAPTSAPPTDLDIFAAPADGGEPRALGEGVTLDKWPSWSPTGDRIVYLAAADRETAFLCIVEVEQESSDCLELPGGLLPAAPTWSPR